MKRNKKKWESLCHRCGLCCYEKYKNEQGYWVIDLSSPCPWLDQKTRLCTIYSQRFRRYPQCRRVNLFHGLFAPFLPPSCGYVRKLRPSWLPPPRVVVQD